MVTAAASSIFPIKTEDIATHLYNDESNFELLPIRSTSHKSPDNLLGNINKEETRRVPVTINHDVIYLMCRLWFGDHSVRFIGYNMNGISQKALTQLQETKNNLIYEDYPVICFSRTHPIDKKTKRFLNAYYGCIQYYKCLYTKLNRVGIYCSTQEKDQDILFFVNIDMKCTYWKDPFIFFGNDDPMQPSIQLCAHELTHGFIDHTLQLPYKGETGALSEAIADIFGIYTAEQIAPESDSLLSTFENPLKEDRPDNYKGVYWHHGDGGSSGLHVNSSVITFFCYLCVKGKQNYISDCNKKKIINIYSSSKFNLHDFVDILCHLMVTSASSGLECTKDNYGNIINLPKKENNYNKTIIKTMEDFGKEFIFCVKKKQYPDDIIRHIENCLTTCGLMQYGSASMILKQQRSIIGSAVLPNSSRPCGGN